MSDTTPHLPAIPDATPDCALLQSGYRYALSLTHHGHDAEDLLQEAWLNLCRRYGVVSSRAALFTTIRHLFIDRCRRARIVAFEPYEDESTGSAPSLACTPGATTDVETLLGTLRPGEREAVYLHYIEGHTADEVGILTHQPRGTVLSLIHRALKKLQAAVSTHG